MSKFKLLYAFIAHTLLLIVLLLIASASSTQVYAAPRQQIDESRNFDAVIVDRGYVSGSRGARDCRTNQLIDLSDGNFGRQVQVGRTYHFENAWIYEGNPGQLFFCGPIAEGFAIGKSLVAHRPHLLRSASQLTRTTSCSVNAPHSAGM